MLDIQELKNGLTSSKIGDRRKAIKTIIKEKISELSDELFSLYLLENQKNKSWEIQCELIDGLGILNYKPALPAIEAICIKNEEHDMITMKAAGCFLRLSRVNLHDINPVNQLLQHAKFSVFTGVLMTMSIDKMNFTDKETEALLLLVSTTAPKREKGYTDARIGLANACAGWKKTEPILGFLNDCLNDEYNPLQKVAKNALKGKYSEM